MAIVTTSPLRLQIGSASITPRLLVADTTMVFKPGSLRATGRLVAWIQDDSKPDIRQTVIKF
jgi:hypothetical protein